jgi:hypothetical protein
MWKAKELGKMDRIEELKAEEKEIAAKINAIESGVEGLKPVVDGIINIEDYVNAKYKILWILKEVHDEWVVNKETGKKQCGGWNLTCAGEDTPDGLYARIKNEPKTIYEFLVPRRIMLASYCIFSGTTDVIKNRNEDEMFKALSSVAYINIKKIPGGASADPKQIQEAYDANKTLLKKQIVTYNPDIIICGNTLQYFSNDIFFEKKNRTEIDPGSQFCYYPLENRIYINTNHPAHKPADKEFWYNRIGQIVNAVSDWKNNYRLRSVWDKEKL